MEDADSGPTPRTDARQTDDEGEKHVEKEAAVVITEAVKIYDSSNAVLRGLNMTVPKGIIYGLLGPSGCGKTTLLSIIVGKSELDSGNIEIKAFSRKDLGYMPQDLNLLEQLTILQTYKFYGNMFNMGTNKILERAKELEKLLELPAYNTPIASLSGGQKRRVSLGVALLHDPNILILDEPTVGLDPILSNSIWNHLVSFAKQGKTIIITTHYIEEARQAHMIGMMREGVLLAQEPPETLIARCNVNTLEEAFLSLSYKQEESDDTEAFHSYEKIGGNKSNKKLELNDGVFRMNRMYCLLYKNLAFFRHEKMFLIFVLLLPLVQTYFFNIAVGHDPENLNIAVVNDELRVKNLRECKPEYYQDCFIDRPDDVIMSCAYIDQIKTKSLKILHYDGVDTALKAVKKNDAWALLYIPSNYTSAMAERFVKASRTSDINVEASMVEAWIDLSDQYVGNMVKAKLYSGIHEYLGKTLTSCNASAKVGNIPIKFEEPVYGSKDVTFINYASAAILCLYVKQVYALILIWVGMILK